MKMLDAGFKIIIKFFTGRQGEYLSKIGNITVSSFFSLITNCPLVLSLITEPMKARAGISKPVVAILCLWGSLEAYSGSLFVY